MSNEQTFDPILLTSTSGGRSRRQGVEFSLNAPLGEYARLTGSWTFTNAKYLDQVTEDGDNLADTRVANTAKYVGSAAIEFGQDLGALVAPAVDQCGRVRTRRSMSRTSCSRRMRWCTCRPGCSSAARRRCAWACATCFDKTYPELRAGGFVSPGQPRSVYGGVSYVM